MSWTTISFFEYDPDTDGSKTFNIKSALNNNWDHVKALVTEIRTAIETNATNVGKKANTATYSNITLSTTKWSNSAYSFESDYPFTGYDLEIQPDGDSITDAQMKAWSKAKVFGSNSANKAIAKGTTPTVDIPVILKVVAK